MNNCVKDLIPYEIELTAINGMRYRDTVKWCLCINCQDSKDIDERLDSDIVEELVFPK
jgi:hypothetical protein